MLALIKYHVLVLLSTVLLGAPVPVTAEPPSVPGVDQASLGPDQACGYTFCDKESGMCMLRANLGRLRIPTTFSDFEMCGYEPKDEKWNWMPFNAPVRRTIYPAQRQPSSKRTDPVVRLLTDVTGLLWLTWKENGRTVSSFLYSGTLCDDVMIGPTRKGDRIATCIPGRDSATAAYVPDPEIFCRQAMKPARPSQRGGPKE
jgi:hypothetical protein